MATTWLRNLSLWAKVGVAISGGALIGTAMYFAISHVKKRSNKNVQPTTQINRDINGDKKEITTAKRILVLGLSGAGKSSILSRFSKLEKVKKEILPTDGFNVMCLQTAKGIFNIWEIGGTEKNRGYWENFLQDTDLLVFVVDSTDDVEHLDIAYLEFRKLLSDNKLKNVPVLLLVNKQDIAGSKSLSDIENHFSCKGGQVEGHHIRILGTRAAPNLPSHPSVGEAERLIISMCFNKL